MEQVLSLLNELMSIFKPIFFDVKLSSIKDVIKPPEPISWPDYIPPFFIRSWVTSNAVLKYSEFFIVGVFLPT